MFAHWVGSRTADCATRISTLAAAGDSLRQLARTWAAFSDRCHPAFGARHLFFATLGLCDFVQTCFILSIGGDEANQIARWVFVQWGVAGAAVYKALLMGLVIVMVEWIAQRDLAAARRLSAYALFFGALPLVFGFFLIVVHFGLHGA